MIFLLKTQLSWGLRTKDEIKGYVGRQITEDDYKSITGEEFKKEG